jgi:hypothetical protein
MVDWTSGALPSANSLLQALLTSSGDCIGILDLDGNLLSVTESGQRVMEVTDFSAIKDVPGKSFGGIKEIPTPGPLSRQPARERSVASKDLRPPWRERRSGGT